MTIAETILAQMQRRWPVLIESTFNLQAMFGVANCVITVRNYHTIYEQFVKTVPIRSNATSTAMVASMLGLATVGIFLTKDTHVRDIFSQCINQKVIRAFAPKRSWPYLQKFIQYGQAIRIVSEVALALFSSNPAIHLGYAVLQAVNSIHILQIKWIPFLADSEEKFLPNGTSDSFLYHIMNLEEAPIVNETDVSNESALDIVDILDEIFAFVTNSGRKIQYLYTIRAVKKKWKEVVDNRYFRLYWENLKKENAHLQTLISTIDALRITYFHKFCVLLKKTNTYLTPARWAAIHGTNPFNCVSVLPASLSNFKDSSSTYDWSQHMQLSLNQVSPIETYLITEGVLAKRLAASEFRIEQKFCHPSRPLFTHQEKTIVDNLIFARRSFSTMEPIIPFTAQVCEAMRSRILGSFFPEPYTTFRVDEFAISVVFPNMPKGTMSVHIRPIAEMLRNRVEVLRNLYHNSSQ